MPSFALARHALPVIAAASTVLLMHCGSTTGGSTSDGDTNADEGISASDNASSAALSGCHHKASSDIPSSGRYELTSFGFSADDNGKMACGQLTHDGNWYYAASRQRYGCGAHIQIQANGKCVVAETDDYGPDVCVENAAGVPIIDASPLVSEHLFGVKSAGWSDHLVIQVTQVDASTPLGPCTPTTSGGTGSSPNSCKTDKDCNGGQEGTESICSSGACVTGCHADTDCSGSTSCGDDQTCE